MSYHWHDDECGWCPCDEPGACECHLDCRDCSQSGWEWHLHLDERCPVHPDALVVS